eukprot:1245999-Pleurochrysis_carterae.AAC.1
MVYVDAADMGWRPYVESWLGRIGDKEHKEAVRALVERAVPKVARAGASEREDEEDISVVLLCFSQLRCSTRPVARLSSLHTCRARLAT